MTLDFITKFGAVLLGAALAWGSAFFFEKRRLKEARKGLAYGLIFKVLKASDDVWKLNEHLSAAERIARQEGEDVPLWTTLPDVLGLIPNPEQITAQELALIADTQDADLVMKILELESGRFILTQALNKIQELRSEVSGLKLAFAVEGRTISFGGPAEDYPNYAHIFIYLNDLSNGLADQAARIAENAKGVADRLGTHLKNHYRFKPFVTLAMSPTYGNGEKN